MKTPIDLISPPILSMNEYITQGAVLHSQGFVTPSVVLLRSHCRQSYFLRWSYECARSLKERSM